QNRRLLRTFRLLQSTPLRYKESRRAPPTSLTSFDPNLDSLDVKRRSLQLRYEGGLIEMGSSQACFSTISSDDKEKIGSEDDDFIKDKKELEPQGVDPVRGWGFRGGMFDQRTTGAEHLPRPAQWHRIAVHNEQLGAYAVQQLVKKYAIFSR
ncbi:hypothetical protein BHE74_00051690, partial [Ensete ventricosum]